MSVSARSPSRIRPAPVRHPVAAPVSEEAALRLTLLSWYDRHRRVLPWRVLPGATADPYRVWLSEIMLQQTTVKAVAPYFMRFLERWPDVTRLAAAPLDDVLTEWAGLGYYARARNLHACAKAVVERHGGVFPSDEAALRALPGVGAYTAAAVAAIAFEQATLAIDGNVERVLTRLYAIEEPLPAAKPLIRARAQTLAADAGHAARHGDFVQAMMDLGATICTPRNPACVICPWSEPCAARRRGDPEIFPRKQPKVEGALRRGIAFVVLREDGAVLLRQRPMKGLLGGMTEVPTTVWTKDFEARQAGADAPRLDGVRLSWRTLPGVVRHVFTHFPLELNVRRARAPQAAKAPEGMRFVPLARVHAEALPSLMRKVISHAIPEIDKIVREE
jgi:A/G-specific adenine glycosylase